MKWALRAIGWASYVLWLILIVFTATAIYSAFQVGLSFGENPRTSTSGGTMTMSLPFSVENNGFYDISDLSITTVVQEINGALVSNSSTVVPLISSGSKVDATHNVSISLETMTSASSSRLLFDDTNFSVELSLALTYAGVIPLKISTNSNMTWGAPLCNLTIGVIEYDPIRMIALVPVSFVNRSFFDLNGTMRIEIVNTRDQTVGNATTPLSVPSGSGYPQTNLEVPVSVGYGVFKEVHLFFDTSVFSYGPKVIPIGG